MLTCNNWALWLKERDLLKSYRSADSHISHQHNHSDPVFFLLPQGVCWFPFQTKIHSEGFSPTTTCLHIPSDLSSSLNEELCDSEGVSYGFGLRNPLWQRAEIWCPGTGQILGTDCSGSSSSGSAGWSDNATGVRDLQVTLRHPKTFIMPRSTGSTASALL